MTAIVLAAVAALGAMAGLVAAWSGWHEETARLGSCHAGARGWDFADDDARAPSGAAADDESALAIDASGQVARASPPAWLAALCIVASCALCLRVASCAFPAPLALCLAGTLMTWVPALAAAVTDGLSRRIPNRDVALVALGGALVQGLSAGPAALAQSLAISGVVACLLLVVRWARGRDSLGAGDVKMLAAACLVAGPGLVGMLMLVSFGCAAAFAAVGMAMGRLGMRSGFAFGPFIALGILSVLWYAWIV